MPQDEDKKKEKVTTGWDKLKVLSGLIASIFIPVALALIGNWYSSAISKSEISLRYTELAINILVEEPTGSDQSLRQWAINIISTYSNVPMNIETERALIEKPMLGIDQRFEDALANQVVGEILREPKTREAIQEIAQKQPAQAEAAMDSLVRKILITSRDLTRQQAVRKIP